MARQRMKPDMSDVDGSGTAEVYVENIRALQSNIAGYKQPALKMLAPCPGQRILDVGCGAGDDLAELAKLVGPAGRVIGIDTSQTLLEHAQAKTAGQNLPIDLKWGDAQSLQFPDDSFDRIRADRVLQHVDCPDRAVGEMMRVTKPGGRIVLVDADYDALLIDADDVLVTQTIVRRRADAARNGRIGRMLWGLMREFGVVDIQVEGIVFIWNDYDLAMTNLDLASIADEACHAGELLRERVDAWLADLVERAQQGKFFLSSCGFIVSGQLPTN